LGGDTSVAYGINALGDVVGSAMTGRAYKYHAFLWHDGKMIDLTSTSAYATWATAINVLGEIVGCARDSAVRFENGGFVYLSDEVENLEDWNLHCASDVNDEGAIVGWGTRTDGHFRAFLLKPVD